MKIDCIPATDLTLPLIERWHAITSHAPELASPYFRPEFVQAVASHRPRVEVAVLEDGAEVVGFFPFERQGAIARPVGGRLSDYQGVIAAPQTRWSTAELLAGCRLGAWEFDHQLASQAQLAPHFAKFGLSRRLDLRPGYEAYLEERRSAGAKGLGEWSRKLRKFQRDADVRFEWHTADPAVFEQLLAWKSQQYVRTGLTDLFQVPWIVALLRDIWQTQLPHFRGVLSALYADGQLAAAHFSMHSGGVLHSWFPAYDVELSKHSPGVGLLLLMAQHAASQGVQFIDLGKGEEDYKLAYGTSGVPLAEGVVETRMLSAAWRATWRQTRDWVRQSPLHEPARVPIRWLRQVRDWVALR
jgi:CelD/BcsL family acetyltransferase involved in cellulose biosynthesis